MAKQEESDENWISTMDDLCSQLNVDPGAIEKSKESFAEVKKNFTLDGDILHWMACALYVACRTSITPTVESGKALKGNCVSLTKLLRLCNISLIQFFTKIKNWMDMTLMPNDFKDKISRLEHKFAVSTILFRKFQPLFQEIFVGLTNEPVKIKSSKKHKLQPCNTNALFNLTWCLYVSVKGEFHNSADDLVDMYHLLLSCLDCVFANAFMANRRDLLNPNFKGLPSEWSEEEYELPEEPPCIISVLCELKDGLAVQASTMKDYSWNKVIRSFFDKGILKGDSERLLGILDVGNFEANVKSLNNQYETYVLSVGEFDERIFLGEHAQEQIGTKKVSENEMSQVIARFGPSGLPPETPLTGRQYLGQREPLTPVSEATNSLARLAAYLRHAQPHPSAALMRLFAEKGVSAETVRARLEEPCAEWTARFAGALRESQCSEAGVRYRCRMLQSLHYAAFEAVLRAELRRKPRASLAALVALEPCARAVWACCAELLVQAHGAHSLRFPRVLQLCALPALHFYKVIELVVRALLDHLSRDLVKHLNAVEEQVLEALVWRADSPLWQQLAAAPAPPSALVTVPDSPFKRGLQSPVSAALDRYHTPMAEQAKKQLFKDKDVKPGQSLLVQTNVKQESAEAAPTNGDSTPNTTPKKTNSSLILFFRKFYSLAVVRMNDLCTRLRLTDEELRRKVWTCFEHSLLHQTHLLRDRHLDQLLMCAVYVICKVSNSASNPVERTFADIMRCYRARPLADNHVYRSVLIRRRDDGTEERGDLINFYNKVYVQCMQSFALRFTSRNKDEWVMSPLPASREAYSPGGQRVSAAHQLYVKPLPASPPPQDHHLTYLFSRSPAKDLHAINSLVMCEAGEAGAGGKRAAEGGEAGKRRCAPGVARKLHSLVSDRQAI